MRLTAVISPTQPGSLSRAVRSRGGARHKFQISLFQPSPGCLICHVQTVQTCLAQPHHLSSSIHGSSHTSPITNASITPLFDRHLCTLRYIPHSLCPAASIAAAPVHTPPAMTSLKMLLGRKWHKSTISPSPSLEAIRRDSATISIVHDPVVANLE